MVQTMNITERLLQLPEPKERVFEEKRFAEEPNIDLLNEDQQKALNEILTQCLLGANPMHLLQGYAGTGKTFLTSVLIELILHEKMGKIAIAAPTNKAVKVIKDNCPIKDSRIKFDTVHSLLGLRENIDGYGKVTFVQKSAEHAKLTGYAVMILDETSMLSDDLFVMLDKYTANGGGNMKIVFIGDPAQIPPVGKEDSIPFKEEGQKRYNIGVSKLTEIVRQAKTNPLIAFSMKLRNNIGRPDPVPVKEDAYDEETMDGLFHFSMHNKEEFHALMDKYFNSENYLLDSDFVKIIGWRNATVNNFNIIVRKKIYGDIRTKIAIGERLIVNKPIMIGEDKDAVTLFTTNDEITVRSLEIDTSTTREMDFKYYVAGVSLNGGSADQLTQIKILHEDSEELFTEYVSLLAEIAKSKKKGGWEAAAAWKDFFRFQEIFANVSYSYAITAHKSQGSTYDNTFVLESDLDANRKIIERNRIKYTACTRPRNKLFIVD